MTACRGRAVLVACEDAGAARGLAPALARLRDAHEPLRWLLGPVAARCMREQGLARDEEEETAEVSSLDGVRAALARVPWDDVGVVVTGSTTWGLRLEAHAIRAAREARRPTMTLLDFWSNYEARLTGPEGRPLDLLPDRLAVIDAPMCDALRELGADPARVTITGSPAFDRALELRARRLAAGSHAAGDARPPVLFLSQPIRALYADALGYTEHTVLRALDETLASLGASAPALVVRPHPREDADALRAFVAALPRGGQVQRAPAGDLLEDAVRARLVVGMTSAALIETALAGVPTVSAQPERAGADPLPASLAGLIERADTYEALRAYTLGALRNRVHLEGSRVPRGFEPGAAQRLAALILETRGSAA